MIPTTVSLFCGAGGESLGKDAAFRDLGLDVQNMNAHALNHWDLAVAAHGINLPWVKVHREDITAVTAATYGLDRINLLWASPSCVHFSRARGGAPTDATNNTRSHAWEVVDRWLRVARVDVLLVENVPEFEEWGPLDDEGHPIKARKGEFFREFVAQLRGLGYMVDWRVLCAADYGDPTTRRRFFLQAARDGLPVTWPEPTHRDPRKAGGLFDDARLPWRTAAECIDWSIPCPSIFDRKKPLAPATMKRIAAGVVKYVLNKRPFVVNLTHGVRNESLDEPFRTLTGANRGEKALVAASLIANNTNNAPHGLGEPLATVTGGNRHYEVAAFLAKHYGGPNGVQTPGSPMTAPVSTVTGQDHNALVAAHLMTIDQGSTRETATPLDAPMPTATTKNRHALVAAFIQHYYGTGGQGQQADQPLHTITTLARHGLVTVEIDGETYVITDIGMRMLEPHELARSMGFPESYRWEGLAGKPLSKRDRVKMIGNAVPVNLARSLVREVVQQRPAMFGMEAA